MNDAVVAQLVFGVSLAVITSVVAVQIANINITYTVSVRFSMPMVNIVKSRQGSPNVAQINTCLSKLSAKNCACRTFKFFKFYDRPSI